MAAKKTQEHNATSDRLLHAGTTYHREAERCLKAKAYFAATVMQMSVLEAALQAMSSMYIDEVKKTAVYQKKKFKRKRDRALEFSFYQLINIARELNWFPPKIITVWGKRTDLAGFVHEARQMRNLLHPAIRASQRNPLNFSKGTWNVIYEIFEVANSWLIHRVHRDIHKRIKKNENRQSGKPNKRRLRHVSLRSQHQSDIAAADGFVKAFLRNYLI